MFIQQPTMPSITAARQNLSLLIRMRWLLVGALLIGTVISKQYLHVALPYTFLWAAAAVFASINIVTTLRLHAHQEVSPLEFFAHILSDILLVSVIFYACGGATNPFISYYLVPVTISMVTLPWRYTVVIATLCIALYSMLLFYYLPVPALEPDAHHLTGNHGGNAHILGMWFNFILSVSLISYFVTRMAHALNQQQQLINQHREETLHNEQLLAVATLAAGTAHELGTPLNTIKLLADEMLFEHDQEKGLQDDLHTLQQQVNLCSRTLKKLTSQAEKHNNTPETLRAHVYCQQLIEHWQVLRPDVNANITLQNTAPQTTVCLHSTIEQAVMNLLNNAADACEHLVDIAFTWDEKALNIVIRDDGHGLPAHRFEHYSQAFYTSKEEGLGLGLFLSNATIARYGGTIEVVQNGEKGTTLAISLPLQTVAMDTSKQ